MTGQALGAPLAGNAIAWKLMMAACLIGFAWGARAYLERRGDPDRGSTLALAALTPLLPWEIAGQGHNEGLLLVALLLFTVAATEGRAVWAAIGIALALHVKISVAPIFVLYFVFLVGQRRLGAIVPALAAVAVLVLAALPYLHDFHGFGPTFEAIRGAPRSHSFGDFLFNVLAPLGPTAQDVAVRASFWLAIALCAPAFGHALLSRTPRELLRRSMVFFLVWDLTIPTFEPWYLAWLAPFVVVEIDPRWRRLVWVYASFSAILWIAPIDPFSTMALNGYIAVRLVRPAPKPGRRRSRLTLRFRIGARRRSLRPWIQRRA